MERTLRMESRIFHNFRALGELFQTARESVTGCRAIGNTEVQRAIQSSKREAPFLALAAKRTGVLIVRIQEENRVDHAIVVDAMNGVIIGSESSAVALSVENLARCGGDIAGNLRVIEVREIKGGR